MKGTFAVTDLFQQSRCCLVCESESVFVRLEFIPRDRAFITDPTKDYTAILYGACETCYRETDHPVFIARAERRIRAALARRNASEAAA